jgi:methylated-DNA-[protein]-cysteine S-methyltransferase
MKTPLHYCIHPSPIGPLTLVASEFGLVAVYMERHLHAPKSQSDWRLDDTRFGEVCRQLDAYFAGVLQKFDLPLDLQGTPFQLRVWHALQTIPYGETVSYGEQARRMDHPQAVRAVGLANGRNPISIVVPCHRVIGKNGSLTGYGGGLERKRYLLDLERSHFTRSSAIPELFA